MFPHCGRQFVFLVEVDIVICEVPTVHNENTFQSSEG